jgi:putative heme-binding domain-containing protein
MKPTTPALAAFFWLSCASALWCRADDPHWIWHHNQGAAIQPDEVRYFRKTFHLDTRPQNAVLTVAADDDAVVFLNGKEIFDQKGFDKPEVEEISELLKRGDNVIAIRAHNASSDQAGLLAVLELKYGRNRTEFITTDASWVSSAKEENKWTQLAFGQSGWSQAVSRGQHGSQPWGKVLTLPKATAAEKLTVLPGFKVELLHSSQPGQGSWICLTADPKGRLIISPQADNQPLLRFTIDRSGQVAKIEKVPAPVRQAMGLLYAHNSLYVNGHGPKGTGLYRLIDANRNDQFDTNEVQLLKNFEGEGEHGYHGVVLGPDKMIYVMNGNHTKVPKAISDDSPHKNYQEDFLLARQWDAGGHAVGILAPGGYVVRTDPEGKRWELMLAGFRNAYDLDFNADGELFTYDSDMEWDWGLPWYRPTRINHCVTGAEFGWRSGSAVWPEYYADSLPATVDLGVGSPTGVRFGTKSRFPEKYRSALYAFDWSYGRIFAVHLTPDGASYRGDYEVLVKGKPLNLTDLDFGKDGAMYFITGGRGTQSGLYRVTYTGKSERVKLTQEEKRARKAAAAARQLRHELERFHGKKDPQAVEVAWPHLGSEDRFIRGAARIALEWQDLALWKERALKENQPQAGLTALLALARCGGKETQRELLMALQKFPIDSLPLNQKLEKLRIVELSFIRQGKPDPDLAAIAIDKLSRLYPNENEWMNRELSQLLIYLEAPDVVGKTLTLLEKARTQEEQAHYIFYLRNLQKGWTLEQRHHYFEWFRFAQETGKGEVTYPRGSEYFVWANQTKASERHPKDLLRWFKEAGRDYGDGASYPKYLVNIRKDAAAALTEQERFALGSLVDEKAGLWAFKPTRERQFVQEWKMADLEPALDQVGQGRNYQNGKAAFNDAQCLLCHRLANEGGSVGPELTAALSKYTRRDVLEALLDPSKVVSDQYQNVTLIKKDGEDITGRIVDENDDRLLVHPSPLLTERVEVKKADIAERRPSPVSPMPQGLLNQLSKEEILDLIAYIEAMGKERGTAHFRTLTSGR